MNYKRLNVILVFILVVLLWWSSQSGDIESAQSTKIANTVIPTVTATPTAVPTPTVASPKRIRIDKLGIDTMIEPVGNDVNGKMLLPQETDKVGWYMFGYIPGEVGNAVIGGHLDLTTGAPAVFYRLKELTVGDEIVTTDETGKQRVFRIYDTQVIPYDQVSIDAVFGHASSPQLNLITCAGWWNRLTHNYSDRLIIFTKLLSSS